MRKPVLFARRSADDYIVRVLQKYRFDVQGTSETLLPQITGLLLAWAIALSGQAPMQIKDVVGLQNQLELRPQSVANAVTGGTVVFNAAGQLDKASGIPSDCVHVDGTSGPCSQAGFVDADPLIGALDGINTQFGISLTPDPITSLKLYRNGVRLTVGVDYSIAGRTITFLPGAVPKNGDLLQVDYRSEQLGASARTVSRDVSAPTTRVRNTDTFAPLLAREALTLEPKRRVATKVDPGEIGRTAERPAVSSTARQEPDSETTASDDLERPTALAILERRAAPEPTAMSITNRRPRPVRHQIITSAASVKRTIVSGPSDDAVPQPRSLELLQTKNNAGVSSPDPSDGMVRPSLVNGPSTTSEDGLPRSLQLLFSKTTGPEPILVKRKKRLH